jgi:undecaprenyl-diphosphatase
MRRAILLGLLQGPTEMAPVSSSAHTALLARILGRCSQDPSYAKSFEVALHGGTAFALVLQMGGKLRGSWKRACIDAGGRAARQRLILLGLSVLPPALAGYVLEGPIERRGSGPRSIGAGLVAGAVAMGIADRRGGQRRIEQAGAADALALGLAQAGALMPGVSRRGATLAAARLRGFSRADADELSWLAGIPVILGACTLKGSRLLRQPPSGEQRAALLAGAGTAFASTLASAHAQSRLRVGRWPLAPFCVYRLLLALWMLRAFSDDPPGSKSPKLT